MGHIGKRQNSPVLPLQRQTKHPLDTLQKQLETQAGRKLKVRINDNRSTMLSVCWEPDHTRVSLHRMFLKAPSNVMTALGTYLKGKNRELQPAVKAYIEECRQRLDYSHTVDQGALCHQGRVYNLQEIYDEINRDYFGGKLRLHITWFGEPRCRNRSRISFGLYHDTLKLIKINRILDKNSIPRYLVSYVIFHEMLHHVCPPFIDEDGVSRIHNEEFKRRELAYRHYHHAIQWIRENRRNLFSKG